MSYWGFLNPDTASPLAADATSYAQAVEPTAAEALPASSNLIPSLDTSSLGPQLTYPGGQQYPLAQPSRPPASQPSPQGGFDWVRLLNAIGQARYGQYGSALQSIMPKTFGPQQTTPMMGGFRIPQEQKQDTSLSQIAPAILSYVAAL